MAGKNELIQQLLGLDARGLRSLLRPLDRGVMRDPTELDPFMYKEVELDPKLFNELYREQRPDHAVNILDPDLGKYHRRKLRDLKTFLSDNPDTPMKMPTVGMASQGLPEVGAGRHRLALAEAAGLPRMTATIHRSELPLLEQLDVLRSPLPYAIDKYKVPKEGFSIDELTEMGILPSDDDGAHLTDQQRNARYYVDAALEEAGNPRRGDSEKTLLTGTDWNGNLGSALTMETRLDKDWPSYIYWLGSMDKGGGTQMMKEARDQSRRDDAYGLQLLPADEDARGFYESLGMKSTADRRGDMHIDNNRGWLRGAVAAPFGALTMDDE